MHTMYETNKKKSEEGLLGLAFLVKIYYDDEKGVFTPGKGTGANLPWQKGRCEYDRKEFDDADGFL